MASLGTLVASLSLDYAEFTQGIDRSSQQAQQYAQRLERNLNSAVNSVKSSFAGFGAVVTGTVAAALSAEAAFSKLVMAVNDLDKMDELSGRIGVTTERLSQLAYAAKLNGVELEGLTGGLKKLSVNSVEAANGNKELKQIFDAFGISLKNTDGTMRSSDQLLVDVAESLKDVTDTTQLTAIAVKLFGKSGEEMVPMLKQGAEGIKKLTDEADSLGATMSSKASAEAARFNDNLDRLQTLAGGSAKALVSELLPALNSVSEALISARKSNGSLSDGIITLIREIGQTEDPARRLDELNTKMVTLRRNYEALKNVPILNRASAINLVDGENQIKYTKERQIDAAMAGLEGGGDNDAMSRRIQQQQTAGQVAANEAAKRALADQSAAEKAKQALEQQAKAREDLINSIQAKVAATEAEIAAGRKLTEAEKLEVDVLEKIRTGRIVGTKAQLDAIKGHVSEYKALEKTLELKRKAQEVESDRYRMIRELSGEISKETVDVEKSNQQLRDEIELIGLKGQAVAEVVARRAEEEIAVLRVKAAELGEGEISDAMLSKISALEERAKLVRIKASKEATAARVEEERQANVQLLEDLTGIYKDLAVRGGKEFGKQALSSVKIQLESQAFRVSVQALLGIDASGLANGSGLLGSIGQGSPLSSLGQVFNAAGAFANFGAAQTTFANAGVIFGSQVGQMVGATEAATGALATFGMTVGQAVPYVAAAYAGYKALESIGVFGKGGGPKQEGGFNVDFVGNGAYNKLAEDVAGGIQKTFMELSKSLGREASLNPYLFIGVDSAGTANTQLSLGANLNGQNVYDRVSALGGSENVGRTEAELQQAIADASLRSIIAGLKGTDFADNIDAIFANIDPLTASMADLTLVMGKAQEIAKQTAAAEEARNKRLADFAAQGESLAIELLQVQGRADEAKEAARQLAIRGFGEVEIAAYDANQALRDQIEGLRAQAMAAEEQRKAAEAIENQRLTLEQRLLQLQGNTAELRRRELAALDPLSRAIQEQIYALEDNVQLQNQRTDALAKETAALERMVGLGRSIADYVRGLSINNVTLTPQQRLQNTGSEFNRLLTLARGGDENALSSITSVSDSFLKSAQDFYGATEPFQNILERVKGELGSLPAVKTYQEKVLDTLRAIAGSVDGLDDQFVVDLSIAAKSEIEKLIKFVAVTDQLPDDLKFIALATSSSLVRTVDAVLASGINNDAKALALKSSDGINRILNLSLGSINAEAKSFAVASSSELTRFINAVLGSSVSDEAKRLAFANSDSLTRTIQIALGVSDQIAQRALFSTSETVYKTVQAILGSTASQQAVAVALAANNEVITTVNAVLGQNTSAEFAQFLQTGSVNRQMFLNTVLNSSVPDSLKNLVLNAQSASDRAVVLSVGLANQLSGDVRKVLDSSSSTIQKLFQVGLQNGTLNATEQALLYAESQTIQKTINGVVNTGNLDATQSAVLKAATGISNNTIQAQLMFANSLSPDGGILAYSREQVAAAYFHNGRYLSHWLSDIATYTAQTVGAIQAMQAMFQVGQGGWARVGGLFDGYYMGVFSQARNGPIATFAQGGLVTGPGTGTSDSINARLSNREFVMKAAAVKRFGVDFMDQINAGNLPVMPVGMPQSGGFDIDVLVAELKAHRAVSEKLLMTLERKNFEPTIQTSVNVNGRQIKQDVIEQLSDDFRRGVQRFVGA